MGARILVIEDNPANLELMRYVLAAFGHVVTTAVDGEEGYDGVVRDRPDLVICDLQLPRIDGFEVARRMKKHPALQGIPLVAVTAFAMVGDRDRVLAAGFDGYIAKPIEPQSFVTQVDAFLARAQKSGEPWCERRSRGGEAEAMPAAPSGKRILVVDDVATNIDLLRTLLGSAGHAVTAASNLAAARSSAEASAPDLIISDHHIGSELGTEFVTWIRAHERLSGTPFLLMSSTGMTESQWRKEPGIGADAFLARPVNAQTFLTRVAECLATLGNR
jgi:two-component system cell cycle response regulator